MALNVEIKARIREWEPMRMRAAAIADGPCQIIEQHDVFFRTLRGRLKLRVLAPDRGYLVYYEREDAEGPKASNYMISETGDPASLEQVLGASLGVRGIVDKTRHLYTVGQTRVHLDRVRGLGEFLELEVVLAPDQGIQQAIDVASETMRELGVLDRDLVEGAYIDLLEASRGTREEQ